MNEFGNNRPKTIIKRGRMLLARAILGWTCRKDRYAKQHAEVR